MKLDLATFYILLRSRIKELAGIRKTLLLCYILDIQCNKLNRRNKEIGIIRYYLIQISIFKLLLKTTKKVDQFEKRLCLLKYKKELSKEDFTLLNEPINLEKINGNHTCESTKTKE